MSTICTPALKTKPIPTCIGELTIGTIPIFSSNILIYIKDITVGETYRFQETSDGAGLVTIDLSEQDFSDKHSYELWITLVTTQEKLSIKIGDEYTFNAELNFYHAVEDGSILEAPQMTLEVE